MKNVLITGGTSGIGFELAKIFAKQGYGIVLVSSNKKRLEEIGNNIRDTFNTAVLTYQQDLSKIGGALELYNKIKKDNISVSILVNNAGIGLVGATEEIELESDEKMIILNVINLVSLCKLYLADMYMNKQGKILNIASIGAFQAGPYSSTYFASKAFVLSYTKAIRYEARKKGIDICTLCPGATKTDFFNKEGMSIPRGAMSAEKVAEYAYKQLMKNKEVGVPGLRNKIIIKWLPEKLKMRIVAKMKNRNILN